MVDLRKDVEARDYRPSADVDNDVPNDPSGYGEETAAEIAAPVSFERNRTADNRQAALAGSGIGYLALALSIISLFVMPVLLGAAGIIVGFFARRRGAEGLGAWAIGIGAVSMIIGLFITPFF